LICASRSPACEELCMTKRSAVACSRMAMWVSRTDATKEFFFTVRACEFGDAENCHVAGGKAGLGEGTPKSLERRVELYERGCDFGSKECCVDAATELRLRPLSGTDLNGRRAEALFARGGDFHAAADVSSDRCNHLCTPKLPLGQQGCTDALRDYQDVLAHDTTITAEEREASYGAKVRLACEHIKFAECANYPDVPEENPPTTMP